MMIPPKAKRAALACFALGAIAVAILWDRARGKAFHPGVPQFVLLLLGGIALLGILPPVERTIGFLLRRSREESPEMRLKLQRQPLRSVTLYGLWFALTVGFGEAFFWAYDRIVLHAVFTQRMRYQGFDFVWGLPLSYIPIFASIGLIGLLVTRRWAERFSFAATLAVFLFCGVFSWLFFVRGLENWASGVLAAGLTVQLVRVTTRHAGLFHRLVRSTLPIMALLVGAFFVGLSAWPRLTERNAIARLPDAPKEAPNVLLIVLDTTRTGSMSLYGYNRSTTPNLDAFAKQGAVFEHAISPSPWTLPSHGSMFTGRFPHELTADWTTPIDATHPTLAEALGKQGYLTAGFISNTAYVTSQYGLGRGFVHYEGQHWSMHRALDSNALGHFLLNQLGFNEDLYLRKSAERVNRDFLSWLDGRPAKRPYFVFLNYFDTHDPYLPPEEFARKFSPEKLPHQIRDKSLNEWSAADIRKFSDAYDGSLAYLDHQLGRLFAELERRGELKNTLVIVTADHGEQFGEHGLLLHANSLYLPLLHVPLIVRFPGTVPEGRRIDPLTSLRDLPATVIELTGLSNAIHFPGESFTRYWKSSPAPDDEIVFAEVKQSQDSVPDGYPAKMGAMSSILYRGMHYIKNKGTGREELYDLKTNFRDDQELALEPKQLEIFRSYLDQFEHTDDSHPTGP